MLDRDEQMDRLLQESGERWRAKLRPPRFDPEVLRRSSARHPSSHSVVGVIGIAALVLVLIAGIRTFSLNPVPTDGGFGLPQGSTPTAAVASQPGDSHVSTLPPTTPSPNATRETSPTPTVGYGVVENGDHVLAFGNRWSASGNRASFTSHRATTFSSANQL